MDMTEGHMMHCMIVFLLFVDHFHADIHLCQTDLVDLDPRPIQLRPLRPLANYKSVDPFEDRGLKRYGSHLHLQASPLYLTPQSMGCS
jgi:hypothetical protein